MRQRRNDRYSLRAFARSLDLSPAMLTGVLSKRKGLSLQSASNIAEKLKLNDIDASYFCDLVVATHSRSVVERKLSMQRVSIMRRLAVENARQRDGNFEVLVEDEIEFIKQWYHVVILEYINLRKQLTDIAQLAADLDIGIHVARESIERLRKLGLIEKKDDAYRSTGKKITTSADIPSEIIRGLHQQFLDLAKNALHQQPVEKRDYSVAVAVTSKEKISAAKAKIQDFRRELLAFLEDTDNADALYGVNIQMFSFLHERVEANERT